MIELDHESVFLARYGRLLALATRLTNMDRQRAEDIVHDVYVQFCKLRPELKAIQNLDGYLSRSVRYMHLLHVHRRRQELVDISLVEFATAETQLGAASEGDLEGVRDQLWAVCRWACDRNLKSRNGTAVLLRFFHGFSMEEVSLLLKCSRSAAEERLRVGKLEAAAAVREESRRRGTALKRGTGEGRSVEFLLLELRAQIWQSNESPCLALSEWSRLYGSSRPLKQETVAHLATCPECLGMVCEILGIRADEDRYPPEVGGGLPSDGAQPSEMDRERARRDMRERLARISGSAPSAVLLRADGEWLGSLSAARQTVRSFQWRGRWPECIEIVSEDGTCLMQLLPEAQGGTAQGQRENRIWFSDRSYVEVELGEVGSGCEIRVRYGGQKRGGPSEGVTKEASRRPFWNLLSAWRRLWRPRWRSVLAGCIAVALVASIWVVELRTTQAKAAELLVRCEGWQPRKGPEHAAVLREVQVEARRGKSDVLVARRVLRSVYRQGAASQEVVSLEDQSPGPSRGDACQGRIDLDTGDSRQMAPGELLCLDLKGSNFRAMLARNVGLTLELDGATGRIVSENRWGGAIRLEVDAQDGHPLRQELEYQHGGDEWRITWEEIALREYSESPAPENGGVAGTAGTSRATALTASAAQRDLFALKVEVLELLSERGALEAELEIQWQPTATGILARLLVADEETRQRLQGRVPPAAPDSGTQIEVLSYDRLEPSQAKGMAFSGMQFVLREAQITGLRLIGGDSESAREVAQRIASASRQLAREARIYTTMRTMAGNGAPSSSSTEAEARYLRMLARHRERAADAFRALKRELVTAGLVFDDGRADSEATGPGDLAWWVQTIQLDEIIREAFDPQSESPERLRIEEESFHQIWRSIENELLPR